MLALFLNITEGPPLPHENAEGSIQFTILHRRGNKPAMRSVAVPLTSDIARNLQKQEEADRREKERVKELTLQINERQEEEDLNEAIASVSDWIRRLANSFWAGSAIFFSSWTVRSVHYFDFTVSLMVGMSS